MDKEKEYYINQFAESYVTIYQRKSNSELQTIIKTNDEKSKYLTDADLVQLLQMAGESVACLRILNSRGVEYKK